MAAFDLFGRQLIEALAPLDAWSRRWGRVAGS